MFRDSPGKISWYESLIPEDNKAFGYLSYDDFLLVIADSCSFSDSESEEEEDKSESAELISDQ